MVELIVFELGEKRCALDLSLVHEVIPLGPVTPVPTAPPAVVGAVNVRGQVVAVLDLAPLLGLPPARRPRAGACGLLAVAGEVTVVLHVTRVCEVIAAELPEETELASLARPVSSELGELSLVDLERAVELLRSTILERALPSPRGVEADR